MKNIYQCEKCGEIFEYYNKCYEHEEKHWTVSGWCREYEQASNEMTVYDKKHFAPAELGIELNRWDSEESRTVHAVAKYVFKEILYEDKLVSDAERNKENSEENN